MCFSLIKKRIILIVTAKAEKEIVYVKHAMCKVWRSWRIYVEGKQIFRLSLSLETKYFTPPVIVLSWRSPGFIARRIPCTASLSEEENGVKPCRIYKTFWIIHTKLICCIGNFKVFAKNWTLVLCKKNQSLSSKIFQRCIKSFVCQREYFIPNNGKWLSSRGTR